MLKLCTGFILLLLLGFNDLYAQLRPFWSHSYVNDETREGRMDDVFATSDGGYVMCGATTRLDLPCNFWIVRVNREGELIWSVDHNLIENDEYEGALSIIETDDGGFLIGGEAGDARQRVDKFVAAKLSADGELIWTRHYEEEYGRCTAVIETKEGEYLLGGTNGRNAYVVMVNVDGEPLWDGTYTDADMYESVTAIREQAGEGFLLAGNYGGNPGLIQIDGDGDVNWQRSYNFELEVEVITYLHTMATVGQGYVLGGSLHYRDGREDRSDSFLIRVNGEGQPQWENIYEVDGQQYCYAIIGTLDDGVLLGGTVHDDYAFMSRVNSGGDMLWYTNYQAYSRFNSIIIDDAGFPVVTGRRGSRGFLAKFAPDHSAPLILGFTPESLVFSVLPGDSVEFAVDVVDLQEDDVYYSWYASDDTLAFDSLQVVHFEELGEYVVKCVVSDNALADSVMWTVTAEEWYIDSYSPDSLVWSIRRPRTVDFSLNVRAIEGVEPDYRWILTEDRGRQTDIGDEADIVHTFDIPGVYEIEGRAIYEDIDRSITWQISVSSVLYWWTPHLREFAINLDADTAFTVIPSNPESDSLEFRWLVDGEVVEEVEDGIQHTFNDTGDHSVTAIVHDGAEVDTVDWTITVNEPVGVEDDPMTMLPTEVTLYPAAPNPFNSTTSIRYFLPRSADVSLTVYDSAGRLVQTLNDGTKLAGEHSLTLQGSELPAGVYLLRLETNDAVLSMKVVLLR